MITVIITTKSGQKLSLNYHVTEAGDAANLMRAFSDYLAVGHRPDLDDAPMVDRKAGRSHVIIHFSSIESMVIEG